MTSGDALFYLCLAPLLGHLVGELHMPAGASHVLAVTACGAVWGWGGNASQQLGLNSDCGFVAVPLQLTVTPQGLAQVCCTAVAYSCGGCASCLCSRTLRCPTRFKCLYMCVNTSCLHLISTMRSYEVSYSRSSGGSRAGFSLNLHCVMLTAAA
jgi:alpha-tubulin suppressor-like RCC1 family protein